MTAKKNKHQSLSDALLDEILAGKFEKTKKLPSEIQLTERFKVSRPTVARALRDLEAKGMIERRVGSGTYLLEKNDYNFQNLDAKLFGVIVPDYGRMEIFDIICGELARVARTQNCHLLTGNSVSETGSILSDMVTAAEKFADRNCDGVFFAPIEHELDSEKANQRVIEVLSNKGIPIVLIDRDYLPFPRRSEFDLVAVDHFRCGYLLAEHLTKLGCKKPAFVAQPLSASTVDLRIAGARAALNAANIEINRNFVHVGNPQDSAFLRSLTAGCPFDAIICANDLTAAKLMQGLVKLKIQVPNQLRIVGIDDVKYATLLSVPLTTVHQPCREIAAVAFRTMNERRDESSIPPRIIHLAPTLVIRQSCGAYL